MLVSFWTVRIMEGENTIKKKKSFWGKPAEIRQKIYCRISISGYCDESEIETEIERLSAEQLKTNGWGNDFSGWQRFISPEESVRLTEEHGWDLNYPISGKININYLDKWTVATASTKLNAKQFVQYLKDYGNLDCATLESIKE